MGESVKAYVVMPTGVTLTAEELQAWAGDPRKGLSGYRVARMIEFRDSLPESTASKVLRRELRADHQRA